MFGIPTPWLIVGAVLSGLALSAAGYATGAHMRGLKADRDIAALRLEAKDAAAKFTAESAAKDAKNAETVRDIDASFTARIAAIDGERSDTADRYARLLRSRPVACRSDVPDAAVNPSGNPGGGPSDNGELYARVGKDFARLGGNADKLVAVVKACRAWATAVGR